MCMAKYLKQFTFTDNSIPNSGQLFYNDETCKLYHILEYINQPSKFSSIYIKLQLVEEKFG